MASLTAAQSKNSILAVNTIMRALKKSKKIKVG
jgi:hypothetical protein